MSGRHPWPPPMKRARHASDCAVHNEPAFPRGECDCRETPRVVVLTVSHYLVLVAFAFLAGMLLAALIIGTVAGKVGL